MPPTTTSSLSTMLSIKSSDKSTFEDQLDRLMQTVEKSHDKCTKYEIIFTRSLENLAKEKGFETEQKNELFRDLIQVFNRHMAINKKFIIGEEIASFLQPHLRQNISDDDKNSVQQSDSLRIASITSASFSSNTTATTTATTSANITATTIKTILTAVKSSTITSSVDSTTTSSNSSNLTQSQANASNKCAKCSGHCEKAKKNECIECKTAYHKSCMNLEMTAHKCTECIQKLIENKNCHCCKKAFTNEKKIDLPVKCQSCEQWFHLKSECTSKQINGKKNMYKDYEIISKYKCKQCDYKILASEQINKIRQETTSPKDYNQIANEPDNLITSIKINVNQEVSCAKCSGHFKNENKNECIECKTAYHKSCMNLETTAHKCTKCIQKLIENSICNHCNENFNNQKSKLPVKCQSCDRYFHSNKRCSGKFNGKFLKQDYISISEYKCGHCKVSTISNLISKAKSWF